MHYFIDGYNMLFRILRAGDDLRTQREALIIDLKSKILFLKIDATLVFDSQYQLGGGSSSVTDTLEIIFTDQGQTADEYILHELKELSSPLNHTVITSDKKLAWLARRRLVKTESVEDFRAMLLKRYKNRVRQIKEQSQPQKEAPAIPSADSALSRPLRPLIPVESPPLKIEKVEKVSTSIEESFDYYLNSFQEEFNKLEPQSKQREQKEKKELKKKLVKPIKRDVDLKESYLSDMERWERAFDKKNKSESDDLEF